MNEVMQESSKNEEQIAYQKEFLSVLGHEFKTPLNPIIGYAEVLLEKFKDDPEARELLLRIRDSGSDMLNKIESILEYNFLCSRETILNPRSEDFKSLLNDFCESAKKKM